MTFRTLTPFLLRPALGLTLTAAIALGVTTALAGEGNPNYLGIFSSTAPNGYIPSPGFYSLAQNQNTVSFNLKVTNLTAVQQSINLELSANQIITYNGLNVANGQPGVVNGAVIDGQFNDQLAQEVQDPSPTFFPTSIGPNATTTLTFTRTFAACGYFEIDVAKQGLTNQKGLSGLEVRVLGCGSPTPSPSASPSPSPSPSPSASPSPSPSPTPVASPTPHPSSTPSPAPSPTPFGGVLAATGSSTPAQILALALLLFGVLALIAGTVAWRRGRM